MVMCRSIITVTEETYPNNCSYCTDEIWSYFDKRENWCLFRENLTEVS